MVREPVTDFHRDGALTAVSTAVTLGTTVHAPSAVCADARNPTNVTENYRVSRQCSVFCTGGSKI